MRMDRLLGLVIYLLNRDMLSARTLAEKFEVSTRTIQRDMETLSAAGIPIGSSQGTSGGYYIMDSYKMNRQMLRPEDYNFILTALKGLNSGYDNTRLEETFEKMHLLAPSKEMPEQHIHLDFGVLREGVQTRGDLASIEAAILKRSVIEFDYTDAGNHISHRVVEPLLITYKWYSWYLFGFCCHKEDYRLFRLSRIRGLSSTACTFSRQHSNAEEILARQQDRRTYINVRLLCRSELRVAMEESFPNARYKEEDEENFSMDLNVPESETGWFNTLLGYAHQVTILEPETLRQKVVLHAKEIIAKYN